MIEVPTCSITARADFILQSIQKEFSTITTVLDELKRDINQLLGFHENTPRINYGPCGVFAQLFFEAWNQRFKEKVHIVFVMTDNREECWHVAVRLPTGELFDGALVFILRKAMAKII